MNTILKTIIALAAFWHSTKGCQFHPAGEYLRFVRVPENLPIGGEVLRVQVYPRKALSIRPVDKADDVQYFTYRDVNSTAVAVLLAKSLEDLVDRDSPQNVLKFRLVCEYTDGDDTVTSYLSATVYVEDINDHSPVFVDVPYKIVVDELTPVGLIIFRGILATDRDKPNTPNSDVQYSIVAGNERGRFALDNNRRPTLQIRRPLDYDTGDREFFLTIMASDRGVPPRSTNTTIKISVTDNDDLPPKFTKGVYRTRITEFYPITGAKIHQILKIDPPIYAFDQDLAIDAQIRYDIIAGNERRLFALDPNNGTLFLEKEIDLEQERTLPGNTFVLQIQASQVDNPLKTGVARVEVEVMDLNDNLPEFEVDFYNISIVENLPNGFSVLQVIATDHDQGDNGEFTYILQDKSGAFSLDSRTGWLTVRDQAVLDREQRATLRMRVLAKEKVPSVVVDKNGSSFVAIEVTLLDANDNNPTFVPSNLYEFSTIPNARVGEIVGVVRAVDPDLGRNGVVLYALQRLSNSSRLPLPFAVEARSGRVLVAESPLPLGRHALFIEASDQPANPSERRYSLAVVTIDVAEPGAKGAFDEIPDFIGSPYEFWVGANVAIGTSIGQIRVTDAVDKNSVVYDLLHSYAEGVPFAVEERSGVITVVDELPKFDRPIYDFEAVVSDDTELTLVTNVTVHVVDPQDERGILMKGTGSSPIEFRVRENISGATIGQLLYKNSSVNNSSSNNGSFMKTLRFIIANQQDVTDDIAISPDGTLFTKRALDRERRDVYRLTVIAQYSRGIVNGAGIYQVTVYVDDENDNAPIFEHSVYDGSIKENCISGTEVEMSYPVKAIDNDSSINAQFTINLFGEGSDMFRLDKHTGKLFFNSASSPLDREEKSSYIMRLVAIDMSGLRSEAKLNITIEDENDNPPRFVEIIILDMSVHILEYSNVSSGISIIEYKNPGEGEILQGKRTRKNVLHKSSLDNNLLRGSRLRFQPLFSLPEHIGVGTPVLRLVADDPDFRQNAVVKYEILSEMYNPREGSMTGSNSRMPISGIIIPGVGAHVTQYFTIQPTTGEVSVAKSLPPESEFLLNISATDTGGLADNITLRFFVQDNNDHAPVFKKSFYNFDIEEGSYVNTVLGKIEATDADFGQNANISYFLAEEEPNNTDEVDEGDKATDDSHTEESNKKLPFEISEYTGLLSVNGILDRESKDKYSFKVVARDNAKGHQLSSSVEVDVNILDVNDNAPEFYGYDELLMVPPPHVQLYSNHNFEDTETNTLVPVYYATVAENSPPGTPITRVFANDSDFPGNGNGLFLFDIPQKKNRENLFYVDSKDGVVSTLGKLDYEVQRIHNVTIIASDLGSPSLTSSALLTVTVIDVPDDTSYAEIPVFAHRYYEVELEENVPVPMKLLSLNVTEPYKSHRLRYSLAPGDDPKISRTFKVEPRNGTIYVTESPDRERRDKYEFKIRLDRIKLGRGLPVMVYPITSERLSGLALNEVKVIVRVTDVNDNVPKFTSNGRPIIAAIPTSANYGYHVVKLQAVDHDAGVNGAVRYQLLGVASSGLEATRFAIDSVSGQIRCVASVARDAGRVFGIDVKATDRAGADDGRSAIANVFVYVIDERKQLVMVMGSKPTDIEKNMENITSALFNATGYDIRVRKLEPHADRNFVDYTATDMYLYAVDPHLNVIIDMDLLQKVLNNKMSDIEQLLPSDYRVLDIASGVEERGVQSRSQRFLLSTLEVGVVVLGCVVFVGALATALCIICIRKNRSKQQRTFAQNQPLSYTLPSETHIKPALFPAAYGDAIHYAEPTDSYLTMVATGGGRRGRRSGGSGGSGGSRKKHHQHERGCVRFDGGKSARKTHGTQLETSATSLHSSGKDSGIVDSMDITGRCQCGHSSTQSDESSTSSYEDSLKSMSHRKMTVQQMHQIPIARRGISVAYPHRRHRSFPEMPGTPVVHRIPVGHHVQHPVSTMTHGGLVRRSSERLILACPGPNSAAASIAS